MSGAEETAAPEGRPPDPTHGQPDRAEAMGRRLARTADRLGMATDQRDLVVRAFRVAMEPRRARIREDHHPDYLHPARTALILMDDARLADAHVLATAAFLETRSPVLRVPDREVERVSEEVADRLTRIPRPEREGDRLLEALLGLDPDLAAVAVAERLDHARHLHLRPREEWRDYHATTCGTYAPVASRTHAALASRLEWWCATFRRRFLKD